MEEYEEEKMTKEKFDSIIAEKVNIVKYFKKIFRQTKTKGFTKGERV